MTPEQMLARVMADNDQDIAACKAWLREAETSLLLRVWDRIQVRHTDPVDEVVSRFAQLGMALMCAELQQETM